MEPKDTPLIAPYAPTSADYEMANGMHFMIGSLMRGELDSVGVCARTKKGENSCFYLDPDLTGLSLSEPLTRLRSMYEMNQVFREKTTAPPQNRTYREH